MTDAFDGPISVLKFGSSVLRSAGHLPRAVHEIYRVLRRGHRILAVVSAVGHTTDELLQRARAVAAEPEPRALAALLATGEAESAALLVLALAQAGINSGIVDVDQAGLRASGPPLDAELIGVDAARLVTELNGRGVAVVPGFAARDGSGAPCVLGRGGSDLTALFVADALRASCTLYKDVDGLYDRDPSHRGARRLGEASWATALAVAGGAVQEKALRFAQARGLPFTVTAPGAAGATRVGRGPDRVALPPPREPLCVALLGHGTVGTGLYRRVAELPEHFAVVGIAVRDVRKAERAGVPARLLHDRCWRLLQKPADVVVELIGGSGCAARVIAGSLKLGRHVVTANKAVVAARGPELEKLARARGVQLLYSASVGGALPALETLRRERGTVRAFSGVLNATSNFVLDSIAQGLTPGEAVEAAQRAGYAEADPRLDLDGTDAAQKLTILARAAFGRDPDRVHCDGIAKLDPERVRAARKEGKAVRLVASCFEGGEARVRPELLHLDHPLGETRGAENRLFVERRGASPLLLSAAGAGRWPTAEAVLADLYDVALEGPPGV